MKTAPEILTMLNDRLIEEHAAAVQYRSHAAMCKNWGYFKLADYLNTRANQELEHAAELQDRILYLGGNVSGLTNDVVLAETVTETFTLDKESELTAIAGYIEGIQLACEHKDYGTRRLLEHILEEEETHLNDIETNMSQITQMGIECYLSVQVESQEDL